MSRTPSSEPLALPQEPDIKEYLEILRRRKVTLFQVSLIVLVLGVVATALARPLYGTHAKVLIPEGRSFFNIVDSNNPIGTMLAAAQPDSLDTQIQVLQSQPIIDEARQEARVVEQPRVIPPVVSVERVGDSNVIQIGVEGGDPQEIARLANAMVDLHVKRMDLAQAGGLSDTVGFVGKEKEKAARELAAAERRLLAFRRDHRIVQLAADQEVNAKEYVALQARVDETASNITSTRAQIAGLRTQLVREPLDVVHESVKENPRRARLAEKLDELRIQRAEILQDFLPTSQRVRALDERIARATRLLDGEPETLRVRTHLPNEARPRLQARVAELESELQGMSAAHNAARAQFAAKRGLVDRLGPWEVQLARLTQERDTAQTAYNSFSDRLRDLEIRSRARLQTVRPLLRAAVPTSPIRPRRSTNLLLCTMLALFIGVAAAFLQEYLDDRINSPEDLQRASSLATLARIPMLPAGQPRLISALPLHSHVAEAYRALRTSLGFAGADVRLCRLLVTSTTESEGKSTTSVNLATAMAQAGKRVVLVDADLRKPTLHRLLDCPPGPGLSELLVGMTSVAAAVRETSIENVKLLSAGAIPPNPAELLGTSRFVSLLAELEGQADLVIIDTPPCLPVTDVMVIAGQADGVSLVARAGETRRDNLKHAIELLQQAQARILGVVINAFQPERAGTSRYHYYYYHHQGYYADDPHAAGTNGNGRVRRRLPDGQAHPGTRGTDPREAADMVAVPSDNGTPVS